MQSKVLRKEVKMPLKTRAKFRCDSVTTIAGGQKGVSFSAVTGGSDENKNFWEYTPSGKLEMNCLNKDVNFVPGKEYYLDIIEA